MTWRMVRKYSLDYNRISKVFRLNYRLAGEGALHSESLTPSEFIALTGMFRIGGPILFDPDEGLFFTEEREV